MQEVSQRDDETEKIFDDQQRLRENLKALKGSAEERALTQRYTQQLADQETRLETLKRESADFQAKSDQAQKDLDAMIQNLDLNATNLSYFGSGSQIRHRWHALKRRALFDTLTKREWGRSA